MNDRLEIASRFMAVRLDLPPERAVSYADNLIKAEVSSRTLSTVSIKVYSLFPYMWAKMKTFFRGFFEEEKSS